VQFKDPLFKLRSTSLALTKLRSTSQATPILQQHIALTVTKATHSGY